MMEAKEAQKIATEQMSKRYKRDFVVLCEQVGKLIDYEASLGRFHVCFCSGRCATESYPAFKNKAAMVAVAKMLKILGYKVKFKEGEHRSAKCYCMDISWKKPTTAGCGAKMDEVTE